MAVYNVNSPSGVSVPAPRTEDRSLGELFADLTRETRELIQREIALARIEMTDKAAHVGKDLGMVAIGGIVALGGLLTLVAFLVLGLAALGLKLWASALIVGLILAAIGAGILSAGLGRLRTVDPKPHQAMEALRVEEGRH